MIPKLADSGCGGLDDANAGCAAIRADVVTDIFSGNTLVGGGAPYTGFVGSLVTPGITFATDFGFNWHPFGLTNFGADSRGTLLVASAGTYTFSLDSDDGSELFIDGSLIIDDGDPHGPNTVSNSTALAAGPHMLEVQFFECCGGTSGVDLTIPAGTSFAAVPEPGYFWLAGPILLAMFLSRRRGRVHCEQAAS
jgi:PA14 domain